ncbi:MULTISPECIES: oxidoreductase [unclassified Streptomyces]|uniref:oxidoreductase n=1 Tax=unclassified Streptomyces TaxID=2593676 RepID=UPI000DB93E0B|nr:MULTISPECIES: oxidoreductase [unclassified Streptomyces]MYU07559.1 oxidoreductase [Streptomyces sp. SID8366]MYU66171.1 oxidoreductase [Streptomyces sp. SID69]RAJ60267.1 two-component flavin-dependent monooxygenase [Streptomyces sp. PsTaAH-130]
MPWTSAFDTAAAHARAADRNRRLSGEVVTALTAAGAARHFVPRRWGGAEGGFAALLPRIAALGEACPSAAWVAMLWAAHGRFAALLPEEGQRRLWGASPDVRIAAGLMPPAGRAQPVPGGRRVTGTWGRVSGIDSADWVLVAAPEPAGEPLVLAVPADAVDVADTWDAAGLRGTGSHTAVLRDVFVPDHLTFPLAELLRGAEDTPERPRCHTAPAQLAGGPMFCAPALGAARRALAVWSRWAAAEAPGSGRPNHESAAVRETLAVASAHVDAAGLLLERAARRADGEPVTLALVAGNRRDAAVAAGLLTDAVERVFRTGGAHLRDSGGELTRLWRDVHTAASHGVLRLEPAAAAYAGAALDAMDLSSTASRSR